MKSAYLWIFFVLCLAAILFICAIAQRPIPTTPDEGVPSESQRYDDEDIFTPDTQSVDFTLATEEASTTYWKELPGTVVLPAFADDNNSNLDDASKLENIPLTGPPCVYGEVVQICDNYCIMKPFEANAEYEQYLDGESIAARLLAAAPYCLVPTTSGAELLEDVAVGDIIRVVFGYSSAKVETAYPDVVVLSTVIAAYPFPDPTFLY